MFIQLTFFFYSNIKKKKQINKFNIYRELCNLNRCEKKFFFS